MAPKNPLGKVKDLTQGAAPVGLHVAGQATSLTAGAASKTSLDAAADVERVDVTPADVARKVARKAPAPPAARKTAPATKAAPGAKLPPRRKVEQTQSDATA